MAKILRNLIITLFALASIWFIRQWYLAPSVQSGEQTPDFQSTLMDGQTFRLSNLQGKYVLLDFWGSWCGPCRIENFDLVALHKKYLETTFSDAVGFEIVSVAIESEGRENAWRKAVTKDGLYWPYHIMDKTKSLRFFNAPIADQFGVHEVPNKFLLGPEGQILLVNPTIEEIDNILAEKVMTMLGNLPN